MRAARPAGGRGRGPGTRATCRRSGPTPPTGPPRAPAAAPRPRAARGRRSRAGPRPGSATMPAGVEQELPDLAPERRAAGLAGEHGVGPQRRRDARRLRALPAAFHALEGHERHSRAFYRPAGRLTAAALVAYGAARWNRSRAGGARHRRQPRHRTGGRAAFRAPGRACGDQLRARPGRGRSHRGRGARGRSRRLRAAGRPGPRRRGRAAGGGGRGPAGRPRRRRGEPRHLEARAVAGDDADGSGTRRCA